MNESQYPRVLIVSPHVLNPVEGAGVLMTNLFAGWPRELLAEIYSHHRYPPNSTLCSNYYRLYSRITASPLEWLVRTLDYLRGRNESLDGVTSFRMTEALRVWIDRFSPNVIYSHLGPLWMTRLTNQIVERLGVPLVVHMLDDYIVDWPIMGHRKRMGLLPVSLLLNRLNRRAFLQSLAQADLRIVVSDYMQAEYARRYGYNFRVFTNGIDPAQWHESQADIGHADGLFRLLYIGSVSANTNLASIRDFCTIVSSLESQGERIQLTIAGPTDRSLVQSLVRPPHIVLESSVPFHSMPERLRGTDLLVLPFNFDRGSRRFIRYSWPTKLSEYMMSGRPILMYGPADTALGECAAREKWAYFVGQRDLAALRDGLLHLMRNRHVRDEFARVARDFAIRRHNINTTRHEFQSALCRLGGIRCAD